jgi:hypothetical protein
MGKYKNQNRLPPFVPLLNDTLDSPAWKALSHGAKVLYIALKRRYSVRSHNNGWIYLSQRTAAQELGSHHNEIARWYRELQHYGFIVMTAPASLGVEGKGKAPRWRLTELGCAQNFPTRDFKNWDGTPFKNQKTKSRAGKPARSVLENRHTDVQENHTPEAKSVQEFTHISPPYSVQRIRHRLRLPYDGTQTPVVAPPETRPTARSAEHQPEQRTRQRIRLRHGSG